MLEGERPINRRYTHQLKGSRMHDSAVMLRTAKHPEAHGERPFAAAQGDMNEVNGVTPAGSSDERRIESPHFTCRKEK